MEGIMGIAAASIFAMAGVDSTRDPETLPLEQLQVALHFAIMEANIAGQPKGAPMDSGPPPHTKAAQESPSNKVGMAQKSFNTSVIS